MAIIFHFQALLDLIKLFRRSAIKLTSNTQAQNPLSHSVLSLNIKFKLTA